MRIGNVEEIESTDDSIFPPRFFVHGRIFTPCFRECARYPPTEAYSPHVQVIRRRTNILRTFLLRVFTGGTNIRPHVFERVFVRGRVLAPCFVRGYSSVDEYSLHKPNTKPTNLNTCPVRSRTRCKTFYRHALELPGTGPFRKKGEINGSSYGDA